MPHKKKPIIAAFDFDGTITTRESTLAFLFFCAGTSTTIKKLLKLSPSLLGFAFGFLSRQQVKERILTKFFAGLPLAQLNELGEAFAKSQALKKLIRPDIMKEIHNHRKQGHRCVLISASIEPYLKPWGKIAGFDDVLCSKLQVTPEGIVTGKLSGNNCWGEEKVRRLKELLGDNDKNSILYAYGDSKGDHDLLAIADYPCYK